MYLPHGSTTVKATRLRHATGARCCRTRPLAARDDQQKEKKKVTCDTVSALSLARRRLPFYSETAPCVRSCARPAQQKPQAGSWRPATPRRKRRHASENAPRSCARCERGGAGAGGARAVPPRACHPHVGQRGAPLSPRTGFSAGEGQVRRTCTTVGFQHAAPLSCCAELATRPYTEQQLCCAQTTACVCVPVARGCCLRCVCSRSALTSADGARSVAHVCCCAPDALRARLGHVSSPRASGRHDARSFGRMRRLPASCSAGSAASVRAFAWRYGAVSGSGNGKTDWISMP